MPNHITTVIRASEEVIDALCFADEADFSRIIEPPKHPLYTSGSCSHSHTRVMYGDSWPYPHNDQDQEPDADEFCWYPWNLKNWGTKWNAYDSVRTEGEIRFDTAWSHPAPVIRELSRRFPDEKILVEFADEDLGSNCGRYSIKNGVTFEEEFFEDPSSDEAVNFASMLKYGQSYDEMRAEWDADDAAYRAQQEAADKVIQEANAILVVAKSKLADGESE